MANAGGAWDNAKKIVETDLKEKGTELHMAAVVGDTPGGHLRLHSSVGYQHGVSINARAYKWQQCAKIQSHEILDATQRNHLLPATRRAPQATEHGFGGGRRRTAPTGGGSTRGFR